MSLRRALAVVVAAWLAFAATGAWAYTLRELMGELAAVPSSRATFVETKTLALLAQPLELTGTLAYTRPDRLERHTLAPVEERMTLAGAELTLENVAKRQKRSFPLAAHPAMWGLVESIRGTLAGDQASLERFYWLKLEGERRAWTLTLEPRDAGLAQLVQLIRFAGSASRVERMEVFEANGDRSLMRIKPAA
jgi:outer membrane lipoprotein-sorting protein